MPRFERREGRLQVFLHREEGEDLAPLGYVGNAERRTLERFESCDVLSIELDASGRDRSLARKRPQQRRLADAVPAEHAGDLADGRLEA